MPLREYVNFLDDSARKAFRRHPTSTRALDVHGALQSLLDADD